MSLQTVSAADLAIRGLHASSPQRLPFGRSLEARVFLLERDAGNVLIYSNEAVPADSTRFERLGGIDRQYLGHWHESMFGAGWAQREFGAPLFVHADDGDEAAARASVRATFSRRHRLDADLEVIPIPGHTPGSTAYLWDSGAHRLLFTADSLYLQDGGWVAAVLGSSDREAYVASLERLAELEFDVLVPWVATAGQPFLATVGPDVARELIRDVADRVRRGQDS
jgi:glyoxylase-like metal-dependent hydrolase (beta-lactamase superfamily II)